MTTFKVTKEVRNEADRLAGLMPVKDAADQLMGLGLTRIEAVSAIAHRVMRRLWLEASAAKEAEGGKPDPKAFVGVAKSATQPDMVFRYVIVGDPATRPTTLGTGDGE